MTFEGIQQVKIRCPFCGKEAISAIYIPPMSTAHTSRVSAGAKTKFFKTKEKYEINSDCFNCGKSQKEIQKAYNEGIDSREKQKKIENRLKKEGLFGEIKTKVR